MSAEIAARLNFPPMVAENTDNHSTAFTVAVDHVDTTTGISAAERSYTIMKCVDDDRSRKISEDRDMYFHSLPEKAESWYGTDTQRQRQIL